MKEAVRVIIKPVVTEKSNGQKETGNQIAFVVDGRSNKMESVTRWSRPSRSRC